MRSGPVWATPMKAGGTSCIPSPRPGRPLADVSRATDEAGFTLIELIITIAILPIVVGGISVALISVFSLQGSVTNRVGDSNDSLVASVNFNRDVQSAEQMTISPTVSCGPTPAPTNPAQTQLLGLEWGANTAAPGGYDTVVSYVSVPVAQPADEHDDLQDAAPGLHVHLRVNPHPRVDVHDRQRHRQYASDVERSLRVHHVHHRCQRANASPTSDEFVRAESRRTRPVGTSAQGVTGVTFKITAPGSQYTYSLVGPPG